MNILNNYLNRLPEWAKKIIGFVIMLSLMITAFWIAALMITVIGWPFMYIIDKITG